MPVPLQGLRIRAMGEESVEYAFFFEGFTGLAVTIGSILTLFVVMQLTGRIRWAERLAPRTA